MSSSGHLELTKWLFQDDSLAAESMLMTVTLHAATALATIVVFRRDIAEILQDLFRFEWNGGTKFSLLIILSMIPAAIIGVLYDDILTALFDRQIVLVPSVDRDGHPHPLRIVAVGPVVTRHPDENRCDERVVDGSAHPAPGAFQVGERNSQVVEAEPE